MSAFNAFSSILSPSWKSMARLVLPSRLELKRPEGSSGQYLFMRHGAKVVFFGRFFAILPCLAAFLAGVNQLSWPRFLVANAAGAVVWATIFGLGAYFFGRQFTHVIGPLSLAAFALGAIAVIGASLYLWRHEAALAAEA